MRRLSFALAPLLSFSVVASSVAHAQDEGTAPEGTDVPVDGAAAPADTPEETPAPSGEPVEGEPATGDPADGDPAAGDPAAGDPAAGDPAAGDPAAGDPAAGDPKPDPEGDAPPPGDDGDGDKPKDPDGTAEDGTPPADEEPGDAFDKLPATERDDGPIARPDGTIPNLGGADTPMGDFMDTRLSFSLSDDNWLAGPGQTTPSSPFVDFSPRSNNQLFFDNLNTRTSGYETQSSMVLHRRQRGFIPGMDTEAALVARFIFFADDETGKTGAIFRDDGSYVRARYFFSGDVKNESGPNVEAVMFPFNTDRMRLGYLYDISWGSSRIFKSGGVASPGMKLQVNGFGGYGFIGAKTARLLDESIDENEANWGLLGGFGWDIFNMVQFDFGGGVFQRGTNPHQPVLGEPVQGGGGSGRVAFHYGRSVPGSIDFRLYRQDPALTNLFRVDTISRPEFSFYVALEYSHLEQTLQDPDNPRSTKLGGWGGNNLIGGANAGAASMRASWFDFNVGADAIYRDLAFILYNSPSLVPYQDLPADSVQTPEFLLALTASYHWKWAHLTPGMVWGVQMPATFTGLPEGRVNQLDDSGAADLDGGQTMVVRNIGSKDILPCRDYNKNRECEEPQNAEPIYATRFALKWDVSRILAFVATSTLFIDNNETDIIDGGNGGVRKRVSNVEFIPPILLPGTTGPHNVRIAGGLFAQARF